MSLPTVEVICNPKRKVSTAFVEAVDILYSVDRWMKKLHEQKLCCNKVEVTFSSNFSLFSNS